MLRAFLQRQSPTQNSLSVNVLGYVQRINVTSIVVPIHFPFVASTSGSLGNLEDSEVDFFEAEISKRTFRFFLRD